MKGVAENAGVHVVHVEAANADQATQRLDPDGALADRLGVKIAVHDLQSIELLRSPLLVDGQEPVVVALVDMRARDEAVEAQAVRRVRQIQDVDVRVEPHEAVGDRPVFRAVDEAAILRTDGLASVVGLRADGHGSDSWVGGPVHLGAADPHVRSVPACRQRRVSRPEQIPQHRAACRLVGVEPEKDDAPIPVGDMGLRQHLANPIGIAVDAQPLERLILPIVVVGDREGLNLGQR